MLFSAMLLLASTMDRKLEIAGATVSYVDCVRVQAAELGRKSPEVENVIEAAKFNCAKQREALVSQLVAEAFENGEALQPARARADRHMRLVDSNHHGEWAAAALSKR